MRTTRCSLCVLMVVAAGALAASPAAAGIHAAGADRAAGWTEALITEVEPNNDCGTANALLPGMPIDAQIQPAGDLDYFAVTVQPGYFVEFLTGATPGFPNFNTYMELYAPDCATRLAQNDNYGGTLYSRIRRYFCDAGTYYLRIRGASASATGYYTVSMELSPAMPPGETCWNPIDVQEQGLTEWSVDTSTYINDYYGSGCFGHGGLGGADVVYTLTLPAGETAWLTVDPVSPTADIALYVSVDCCDINNSAVACTDVGYGGDPETLQWSNTGSGPATYFLVIDSWGSGGVVAVSLTGVIAQQAHSWGATKSMFR